MKWRIKSVRMKIKFNETSVASKRKKKKKKKFPMGGRGVEEERSDMHLHPERYSLDDSFSSENGLHFCIPV